MYSIWAANYTAMLILYIRLHCFLLFTCGITRKERKKKKERSLMSDNKEALWTCLIIIKYHEKESAKVLSLKEWKLVNR